MRQQLSELIDQMERAVQLSLSTLKRGDPQTVIAEHCQIIDSLQARHLSSAQRLASRHVTQAGKRVVQAMSRAVITG